MKKSVLAVLILAVAFGLAGCTKPGASAGSAPGGVAATVGGETITMDDLDAAAKSQLQKVDTEIYRIRKRVLDGLVEEKLIDEAAKKKGMSAEKFMAEEVDAKVTAPTDEEIKALYDSSKDRLGKPFEWDGPNMKVTNIPELNQWVQREYRAGWRVG